MYLESHSCEWGFVDWTDCCVSCIQTRDLAMGATKKILHACPPPPKVRFKGIFFFTFKNVI